MNYDQIKNELEKKRLNELIEKEDEIWEDKVNYDQDSSINKF